MIYFVRRSLDSDKNKLIHKKELRLAINDQLKKAFLSKKINYCKEELSFNRYGKPYLKDNESVFFNISHCEGLGVFIIDDAEVGIDAENFRQWNSRVAKRVFSDREMELLKNSKNKNEIFFRLWTLKESFVKAIGVGISYPMKTCEFDILDDSITAYGCDGYSFSQIIINDEFVCSVCLKKQMQNKICRINECKKSFHMELT